jgi:hypothetical protein
MHGVVLGKRWGVLPESVVDDKEGLMNDNAPPTKLIEGLVRADIG